MNEINRLCPILVAILQFLLKFHAYKFKILPDAGGVSTIGFVIVSAVCVLLCNTMTLSRVVEKSHKWHRNSFVFGVEVFDVELAPIERFAINDGET